jgi:hypothetical protein
MSGPPVRGHERVVVCKESAGLNKRIKSKRKDHMKSKSLLQLFLLLAPMFMSGSSLSAQTAIQKVRYRVRDLGTLGGDLTEPGGINDKGEIEGFALLAGDVQIRAFFWRKVASSLSPGWEDPRALPVGQLVIRAR